MSSPTVLETAQRARAAANLLLSITPEQKDQALKRVGEELLARRDAILEANAKDIADAEVAVAAGRLSSSLAARLSLSGGPTHPKFASMVAGVADVARLPDPTGQCTRATRLDDGLDLYRVTVPVGVLLVIFEARPEVLINVAALALKSSNAVILKGGKEARHSLLALGDAMRAALRSVPGLPEDAVQVVETREEIATLLDQDRYIDMVIPRGGGDLVRYIQGHTRIPVLGHADGLCSIVLDASAIPETASHVVVDAKTSYPAACNAVETLLVLEDTPAPVLTRVATDLLAAGVSIRADPTSFALVSTLPIPPSSTATVTPSTEADYDTEFLDLTIAIRTVPSLDAAITHINHHGSGHTDVIITEDPARANAFMQRVSAAGVYWNASSRFADGFRYGFGAEIGVSTNKTHARGPVGLEGLVIYKYKMYGKGQASRDYGVGSSLKPYQHTTIPSEEYPTSL